MQLSRFSFVIVLVLSVSLSACSKQQPVIDPDGDILEVKEYKTLMKTGKVLVDPVHGEEVAFWYGTVGSDKSNGVGYIHKFQDGTAVVAVNLNVLLAEKGTHYEVYLKSADGKQEIDIGELTSIIGDARHSVRLETSEDVSSMLHVEVRHIKGILGESEIVGEGVLKEPAPAGSK